jgi:hypothetical protein
MKVRHLFKVAALICLFSASFPVLLAHAIQSAEVLLDNVTVYKVPSPEPPLIGNLTKGDTVEVSSSSVRGSDGEAWYKVKLPSGELGFVQAVNIRTNEQAWNMRSAGVQIPPAIHPIAEQDRSWSFAPRVLGWAGYDSGLSGVNYGADSEFAWSFLQPAHGYGHRMLALGAAFQNGRSLQFAALSVVYRMYASTRAEPEVRLRFGRDFFNNQFGMALHAGFRYPLTLNYRHHPAFYVEGGGNIINGSIYRLGFWGSAGFAYLF